MGDIMVHDDRRGEFAGDAVDHPALDHAIDKELSNLDLGHPLAHLSKNLVVDFQGYVNCLLDVLDLFWALDASQLLQKLLARLKASRIGAPQHVLQCPVRSNGQAVAEMVLHAVVDGYSFRIETLNQCVELFSKAGTGVGDYLLEESARDDIMGIYGAGDGDGGLRRYDQGGITADGQAEHQRHAGIAAFLCLHNPTIDAGLSQNEFGLGDLFSIQCVCIFHIQQFPMVCIRSVRNRVPFTIESRSILSST
ncbi:hypothetical protein SDC9_104185 [bioreactor metagenome]|uniref:Uncharacterized protein n=1 Tax=bioreactor metagenome TaxID=1076179 RepID=A0A645B2G0_9ZZZZ